MTQTIALLAERLRVTEDIVRRLQGDESIASPTSSHMHNMTLGPGSTYSGENGKHAVRTIRAMSVADAVKTCLPAFVS